MGVILAEQCLAQVQNTKQWRTRGEEKNWDATADSSLRLRSKQDKTGAYCRHSVRFSNDRSVIWLDCRHTLVKELDLRSKVHMARHPSSRRPQCLRSIWTSVSFASSRGMSSRLQTLRNENLRSNKEGSEHEGKKAHVRRVDTNKREGRP